VQTPGTAVILSSITATVSFSCFFVTQNPKYYVLSSIPARVACTTLLLQYPRTQPTVQELTLARLSALILRHMRFAGRARLFTREGAVYHLVGLQIHV
jgi:hypothetical protein